MWDNAQWLHVTSTVAAVLTPGTLNGGVSANNFCAATADMFHVYCHGSHEDHVHRVHLVLAQLPAHRVLARAVNNPSRSFTVVEESLY